MNGISISNRADYPNVSIIFIPSNLDIKQIKLGPTLIEAENCFWIPYQPVIQWFWLHEEKERRIYAFFKLNSGRIVMHTDKAPDLNFSRWNVG